MVSRLGPVVSAQNGTLAGDILRQRRQGGADFETSSELSDWNSNLQATIGQPPGKPALTRNLVGYWMMPLLAFFSRKATSNACTCPLLFWMTEIKSSRCALAMLMRLMIKSVTL